MFRILIYLLTLSAVFLGGCKKDEPALFVLNGNPMVASQVDAEASLKYALFQNVKPIKDVGKAEKVRKSLRPKIISNKIPEMLLLEASKGIAVPHAQIQMSENRYFETFHGKLRDKVSFEKMLKDTGVYSAYRAKITNETQIEAFLTKNYKDQLTISQKTVDETIKSMQRGNELANATNAVIYALATNVWKRAAAGEDFASLARRYSNTIETDTDGDIGENCDYSDFKGEDISVWHAIFSLKAGSVTSPISTSEGLTIFKCYDRSDDAEYDGGVRFHLGRIVFFRALLYDNFSPKYVRSELEKEAREKVIASILSKAYETAIIEFPNGEKDLPKGFVGNAKKLLGGTKK